MKKLLIAVALLSAVTLAQAKNYSGGHYAGTGSNSQSHYNRGYSRQNGTYVAPHYSTNPNRTQRDNYVAKGNNNPHNGKTGKQYVDH